MTVTGGERGTDGFKGGGNNEAALLLRGGKECGRSIGFLGGGGGDVGAGNGGDWADREKDRQSEVSGISEDVISNGRLLWSIGGMLRMGGVR